MRAPPANGRHAGRGGLATRHNADGARFSDRADGGRRLGTKLAARLRSANRPIVLALPRGGVPVAFEVARLLDSPLDVFVARKVGAPGQPEYGIGAIAEGSDDAVIDQRAIQVLKIGPDELDELVADERRELDRRVERYRRGRPLPDVSGRDVVLVDDGLATGVTAEAAVRSLRARRPASLVLAVPTAAPETAQRLRGLADDVISVLEPRRFHAVGQWYERFGQTTDDDVLNLLDAAGNR